MNKFIIILLAATLAACSGESNQNALINNPNALIVLAGSELKDIEPLVPQIEQATGVKLQLNYAGTLGAVERMQASEEIDVAWLSSNRYAMLIPNVKSRIIASERTMLTPVVLGIKEGRAKSLGWVNNDVTWKQIADTAAQGKFTFGMTSPASSNTGFSALLGLAASLSGKGDAIEEKDVDAKKLKTFFGAQRMTAGSSGWLVDSYLKEQDKVDGLINYESTLLQMNNNPALKEKLTIIYPKDGILTADYPIMLINAAKRAAYDKVVTYLRGVDFQKKMVASTLRHPVNLDVAYNGSSPTTLMELPFPAKLATVDAILLAYNNEFRIPTDSTFVLDKSGSMQSARMEYQSGRMDNLKTSLSGLLGQDNSISGRFSRFSNRERISLLPFNGDFDTLLTFDMGSDVKSNRATLDKLSAEIKNISAGGGSAIFSAVQYAYGSAVKRRLQDPGRIYSIVVMTDGENNQGISAKGFRVWYQSLPKEEQGIKIFPILFGEASSDDLNTLASLSGGKVFDSRKSGLAAAFKEIRGYQ